MEEKDKGLEVDKDAAINLNINTNSMEGDIAQRLVELEARLSALESQLEGLTGNTDGESDTTENNELPEEAVSDVEEAASNQADDETMVEEVYEDEEDIVNLRGNLETAGRIINRRFNLADYVADKTGLNKPETLREANAIMATFRKTHTALKNKAEKWATDPVVRHNAQPAKNNMERLQDSKWGNKP